MSISDRIRAASTITSGLLLAGTVCLAGPNAGGTLVLHANVDLETTSAQCGASGVLRCWHVTAQADDGDVVVFFALAAFSVAANPRVAGLNFGIEYGPAVELLSDGASCGTFSVPTEDWPDSGSGIAIAWDVAQTAVLSEAYWFAAYTEPGTVATLGLTPHPDGSGDFYDDLIPQNIDPIADFGVLGFGGAPSRVPCPEPGGCGVPGACCFENGICEVIPEPDCPVEFEFFCGESCEPSPCSPPVPTLNTTWGTVKDRFR